MINTTQIKKDFPILKTKKDGKPLVFLDNGATTQKPKQVINAITHFYETCNANVHRGIYDISQKATELYDETRELTLKFINAKSINEIIFTRNATESINLVAYTWGDQNISAGDEIIVSQFEHHSNLVPWQVLAAKKKAKLKIIPINSDYTLDFEAYKKLLTKKTKLVAITAMSNTTGTIIPVKKIIEEAHKKNAKVLVDAAQSAAHQKTDVKKLNCDFLAFSAHKMLGPTGVGILYAKESLLNKMPPFLYGGDMIKTVSNQCAKFAEPSQKYEAGSPNVAGVVAFAEAIKYLNKVGLKNIEKHEKELLKYAIEKFSKYPEVKIFAPPLAHASSILTFTLSCTHPHDIAEIFNSENIAIRAGQHCTEPLHNTLKIPASARISFYLYNTKQDVDRAEKALKKCLTIFA